MGLCDGVTVGCCVGCSVGVGVGTWDGLLVVGGRVVGISVGHLVGDGVGTSVGLRVGDGVGNSVGSRVGEGEGTGVGMGVGTGVGLGVSAAKRCKIHAHEFEIRICIILHKKHGQDPSRVIRTRGVHLSECRKRRPSLYRVSRCSTVPHDRVSCHSRAGTQHPGRRSCNTSRACA